MSAAFVAEKRRLRASWGTVARMLGRSEHDTRREFDATYAPDLSWSGRAPPPAPSADATGPARGSLTFSVLAAVAAGANTAAAIAETLGRRSRDLSGVVATLRTRGLIEGRPLGNHALAYTATAHGVRELRRLSHTFASEAA